MDCAHGLRSWVGCAWGLWRGEKRIAITLTKRTRTGTRTHTHTCPRSNSHACSTQSIIGYHNSAHRVNRTLAIPDARFS